MYLRQSRDVLQPGLLQVRRPDSHALVHAPHVGCQQLAQIPFSRELRPRLQGVQVSTWVPLQKEETLVRRQDTLSTCRMWNARIICIQKGA